MLIFGFNQEHETFFSSYCDRWSMTDKGSHELHFWPHVRGNFYNSLCRVCCYVLYNSAALENKVTKIIKKRSYKETTKLNRRVSLPAPMTSSRTLVHTKPRLLFSSDVINSAAFVVWMSKKRVSSSLATSPEGWFWMSPPLWVKSGEKFKVDICFLPARVLDAWALYWLCSESSSHSQAVIWAHIWSLGFAFECMKENTSLCWSPYIPFPTSNLDELKSLSTTGRTTRTTLGLAFPSSSAQSALLTTESKIKKLKMGSSDNHLKEQRHIHYPSLHDQARHQDPSIHSTCSPLVHFAYLLRPKLWPYL